MRSDITSEEQELSSEAFLRHLDTAERQEAESPEVPFAMARLVWDQRAFILRWAARGLLIALVLAAVTPNRYSASTRLMPPENQSNSGMAMLAALVGGKTSTPGMTGLAADVLGGKTTGALFVEALQSRTVGNRLVDRFDLRRVYGDRYMVDARDDLAHNTAVTEDRKSGVITIVVNDRDRQRSAQLAQAYVEELNRLINAVSTSSARRERMFIEQRLVTVKQDLHQAAEAFSQFASQNTTLDMTAQTKATVEAAANLQGQLIAAQSQLEGLEQIYTDGNVRVRSLRARVNELSSKLGEVSGQQVGHGPGDGGASDMPFPSIRKLPLLGVRWAELFQEAKIQETVYELLTQQYELAKIQEAKEVPTAKTLDEAGVPERKSFPPRLGFVVLGALLGCITGAVWVCSLAYWEAIEPDDPGKSFALEILGVQKAWLRSKRQRVNTFLRRSSASAPGGEKRDPDLRSDPASSAMDPGRLDGRRP